MTRIVLTPNASITREWAWWFVGSLVVLSAGIAATFAWLGLWLVVPFTGLEILVLVLVFRCCLRISASREVVSVDQDRVRIEAGSTHPEHCCEFHRHWTRVLLKPAPVRGYPSRLLLRSAGRQVEIGSFLTEDERRQVWRRLSCEIG